MRRDVQQRVTRIERLALGPRVFLACGHAADWPLEWAPPMLGATVACSECADLFATGLLEFITGQGRTARVPLRGAHLEAERLPEKVTVRTPDHPAANGRVPRPGETGWTFFLSLDDGRTLFIEMGPQSRRGLELAFLALFAQETGAFDPQEDKGHG